MKIVLSFSFKFYILFCKLFLFSPEMIKSHQETDIIGGNSKIQIFFFVYLNPMRIFLQNTFFHSCKSLIDLCKITFHTVTTTSPLFDFSISHCKSTSFFIFLLPFRVIGVAITRFYFIFSHLLNVQVM